MKTLAPGTLKFLLLDPEVISRNSERGKRGDAIVAVVEQQADGGQVRHVGYSVKAAGSVTLGYNQRGTLVHNNRLPLHAAFQTDGEVLVAETHAEADELAGVVAEPPANTPPTAPAPTKATKATTKKEA
jgi:hypothetical protein